MIKNRLADSGEYSCKPSNALPDSVTIHVLTGFDNAIINKQVQEKNKQTTSARKIQMNQMQDKCTTLKSKEKQVSYYKLEFSYTTNIAASNKYVS